MTIKHMRNTLFVLLAGALFALGMGACTSNDDDGADGDVPEGVTSSEQDVTAEDFIGLTQADAAALAEAGGRPWRVGVIDGEPQDLDGDFRVGRVTFELEENVVVGADIEGELPGTDDHPVDPSVVEDPDAAAILAAAVNQILTVDHSFGVGEPPPFDDVRVANALGGAGGVPMAGLQLEAIAEVVETTGATVEFTGDPRAMIEELFDQNLPGVAVVTIDGVVIESGRAEVEMSLWCGSLCGVYLTYEVLENDGAWTVTGPIGPIAVS